MLLLIHFGWGLVDVFLSDVLLLINSGTSVDKDYFNHKGNNPYVWKY